ncbi:MAG: glycosyltransferase, partial [Candidatus Margulisiibacteriota bacterium]
EAMLSKVAVIGSSSGEIPHVIGDAGLVFPEGNEKALRAHMEGLLKDQNILARWREKAYKRAQEQFTWQKIAKRTREAYLALAK